MEWFLRALQRRLGQMFIRMYSISMWSECMIEQWVITLCFKWWENRYSPLCLTRSEDFRVVTGENNLIAFKFKKSTLIFILCSQMSLKFTPRGNSLTYYYMYTTCNETSVKSACKSAKIFTDMRINSCFQGTNYHCSSSLPYEIHWRMTVI